jgi:hypothetical protein
MKLYALVKGNDGVGKELAVKWGTRPESSASTLAQIGMGQKWSKKGDGR